jgi:hypothetical protein
MWPSREPRCQVTEWHTDVMPDPAESLRYRLITGPDDADFCARVSSLLTQGYRLHGSPAVTFDGAQVIAAQALVLAESPDAGTGAGSAG